MSMIQIENVIYFLHQLSITIIVVIYIVGLRFGISPGVQWLFIDRKQYYSAELFMKDTFVLCKFIEIHKHCIWLSALLIILYAIFITGNINREIYN